MTERADETARMGGFANLDTQQLCALCFTSARSVRRWKRTNTMPRLAHFVLELLFYGNLGAIAREFDGWHLRDGKLHTPEGVQFAPPELVAVPLKYQLISELEKTNRERATATTHRRPTCSVTRRRSPTPSRDIQSGNGLLRADTQRGPRLGLHPSEP